MSWIRNTGKVTPKLPEPNLKTAVFIQVREPVRGVEVR
jgi:hypothetical protein